MQWIQIRKRFQVTIPQSAREDLNLSEGDVLAVEVRDQEIILRPQKIVDRDQAWYWTPEWQAAEREADEDIAAGRYDEFETMEQLIDDLRRQATSQHKD
ncbi:MAG TPA: AbrB/MazE/SpoVT family DNA-binding domain-containing protein [Anaerolineae bacterium]|nr:AbrB/MazE/SpoVT family DNA-binding domain-containing protein [Anaerolineae bacterium]